VQVPRLGVSPDGPQACLGAPGSRRLPRPASPPQTGPAQGLCRVARARVELLLHGSNEVSQVAHRLQCVPRGCDELHEQPAARVAVLGVRAALLPEEAAQSSSQHRTFSRPMHALQCSGSAWAPSVNTPRLGLPRRPVSSTGAGLCGQPGCGVATQRAGRGGRRSAMKAGVMPSGTCSRPSRMRYICRSAACISLRAGTPAGAVSM